MKLSTIEELLGAEYKIGFDAAAAMEDKETELDYGLVPCRYGEIYLHSDNMLAAMVTAPRIAAQIRRELPDLEIAQGAEDAVVFRFRLDQFDQVAGFIKPKKKRKLTQEHRQTLAKSGSDTRFSSQNYGCERSSIDPESTIVGRK